jgi:amidase
MTEDEIVWLDAEGLQRALEADRLDARTIVDAFLARIERLDPALRSWSIVHAERARAAADQRDARRRRGEPMGPLEGVTVALKDLCDVAGEPTRAGTTVLGDVPAQEDAEVVTRLEAAGALVLGKVKMTEGAFVEHHESVAPPINPWNAGRWTGISSSGSGVAAAAGLCTIALGTDTGGSIRYPSGACGLTGLKPTHGRVSLRGVYPLASSLDHIGPMGRSVGDVAKSFRVLAGHDPRDPWSLADHPVVAPLDDRASVRGRVIGYDPVFSEAGVDPEVVATLQAAIDALRGQGVEVVEMRLPDVDAALASWVQLGSAEMANAHAATYPSRASEYGGEFARTLDHGLNVSGREVAAAWAIRLALTRRLAGCFTAGAAGGLDALICPVIPGRFGAGAILTRDETLPFEAAAGLATRFASPFNLSGSPSLTLCGGFDGDGAPIGFQLVGRHCDESTLLELGAAYQRATDHHRKRPL